jgi:hypothetical protein
VLADRLDECFPVLLQRIGHVGGHLGRAVCAAQVRLSVEEVNHATEVVLAADRDRQRHDALAVPLAKLIQYPVVVAVLAIELVDDHQAGQAPLVEGAPHLLGSHLGARDAVDHHDAAIGNADCLHHLAEEIGIPRCVQQVHLARLPLDRRHRQADRHAALDLVRVEVGGGVPLLDAAQSRDRAGLEQRCFDERGLACPAVGDERDVEDVLGVIRLHT